MNFGWSVRHKSRMHRGGLTFVAIFVSVLISEMVMRGGLAFSSWDRLGNPAVYFDPLCDEDYWLALRRGEWGSSLHRVAPSEQHASTGWIPDRSSLDALEAFPTLHRPAEYDETIALFGDSYFFGTTPSGTRISDSLQGLRPKSRILNFGVGGYGLGQILLRLEDRMTVLDPGSWVIIGVLTTDIDRAILQVRDAPKPWFSLTEAGGLSAHFPAQDPVTQWFKEHPVSANSLLWRRLIRTVQLYKSRGSEATMPACAVAEKKALSQAIFSRVSAVCQAGGLKCVVMGLYRPIDLKQGAGWRAEAIQSAQKYGLALIDTAPKMRASSTGWAELYGADDHPNPSGNRRMASWIDQELNVYGRVGTPK